MVRGQRSYSPALVGLQTSTAIYHGRGGFSTNDWWPGHLDLDVNGAPPAPKVIAFLTVAIARVVGDVVLGWTTGGIRWFGYRVGARLFGHR